MNELNDRIQELTVVVVALFGLLTLIGTKAIQLYSDLRKAKREADAADAQARAASEQAAKAHALAGVVVASVDKALEPTVGDPNDPNAVRIEPATALFLRDKMKRTQVDLGLHPEVRALVEDVRKRGETPETGVKIPDQA